MSGFMAGTDGAILLNPTGRVEVHKTPESKGIAGYLDVFFPSIKRNSGSHVYVCCGEEGKSNKEQLRELEVFNLEKRRSEVTLASPQQPERRL